MAHEPTTEAPVRTTLMCYNDTHGYGWRHVDLFVHDAAGNELNWVHWQTPADGPEVADEVTRRVEPLLRRTSDWRHGVSASGMDYWEADAAWADVDDHGESGAALYARTAGETSR